jgi:nucleotide-binding universal stress UspA family protein
MSNTTPAVGTDTLVPRAGMHPVVLDVVAGLTNDGTAYPVACEAAREAAQRGSRVKFLQVAPEGLGAEERQDLDRSTFRAALLALRRRRRVPCTFEVIAGDPATVLIERSADAGLLVVGRGGVGDDGDVAQQCNRNASCDVLTVATR